MDKSAASAAHIATDGEPSQTSARRSCSSEQLEGSLQAPMNAPISIEQEPAPPVNEIDRAPMQPLQPQQQQQPQQPQQMVPPPFGFHGYPMPPMMQMSYDPYAAVVAAAAAAGYPPQMSPVSSPVGADLYGLGAAAGGGGGVPQYYAPMPGMGGMPPFATYVPALIGPGPPIQMTAGGQGPPGCNLFVFHIPNFMTNLELYNHFVVHGTVISVRIMVEHDTGRSRGYGFVSYDDPAVAARAIEAMDGVQIGRKRLKVQLKKEEGADEQHDGHRNGHNNQPHHRGRQGGGGRGHHNRGGGRGRGRYNSNNNRNSNNNNNNSTGTSNNTNTTTTE